MRLCGTGRGGELEPGHAGLAAIALLQRLLPVNYVDGMCLLSSLARGIPSRRESGAIGGIMEMTSALGHVDLGIHAFGWFSAQRAVLDGHRVNAFVHNRLPSS